MAAAPPAACRWAGGWFPMVWRVHLPALWPSALAVPSPCGMPGTFPTLLVHPKPYFPPPAAPRWSPCWPASAARASAR